MENKHLQVSDYNQRIFQLVVENVEDYAVFVIDLNGDIVSWNPGVEKLLGYREEEFIGKKGFIIFTPEDVAAKIPEWELETALKEGKCDDARWQMRRDGSRFWANGLMITLKDETEQVQGFVKIMRDRTLQKELDEEREELHQAEHTARTDAEAATSAKDDFLSVVAHELRSPLSAIKGWISILRNDPTPEMVKKVADIVERQCDQQAQLIEDLLDTAQIVSGKVNLDVKSVNLSKIISSAIDDVRPAAEKKGVILEIVLDPRAARIDGDRKRLLQIVLNLLSNAIKFTPAGGRINVELKREDSQVAIVIKDTGKGLTPEFVPHVFERYQQADSANSQRGSGLGLGLSLVKYLVEIHGGTATAQSEGEGKGSTFTVRLPA